MIARLTLLALPCAFAALAQQRVTHGPMLGHVTSTEVSIWGRTLETGEFRVRYGLAPDALDQTSPPVSTALAHDNTGWARLTGLRPNTKYWYELAAGAHTTLVSSFRTLPDAAAFRDAETNPRGLFNFRFQFGSCANQKPGQSYGSSLPTYATMLRQFGDKLSFSIINGDWLYEDKREFPVEEWRKQVRLGSRAVPRVVDLAPSITGVWENYKYFLERGANLAEWHRFIPSYYTPDDHEILNDVYGTGTAGVQDRRAVFRDIGMQAWYDYLAGSQPTAFAQEISFGQAELKQGSDILFDPAADFSKVDLKQINNLHVHWGGQLAGVDGPEGDASAGDPNAGVYEVVAVEDRNRIRIRPAARATRKSAYSIGRSSFVRFRVGNVEFYLLDTRSQRDKHDTKNPRAAGTSILGRRQREWLKESMARSDADFFFLASSVNMMVPHVGSPGSTFPEGKDDAWTAFLSEREEMIRFWDGLGKPVLVTTGDLHNSFAVKITDRVWEFASGPLGSQNHPARAEGGRPSNGVFDSRGRSVEIRWSSYIRDDVPAAQRRWPIFAVAQVNNVFRNHTPDGRQRWVAYPKPHIVVQYYDGVSGDLLYAEPVHGR